MDIYLRRRDARSIYISCSAYYRVTEDMDIATQEPCAMLRKGKIDVMLVRNTVDCFFTDRDGKIDIPMR